MSTYWTEERKKEKSEQMKGNKLAKGHSFVCTPEQLERDYKTV